MFRRFFQAISNATNAVEEMAASVREANANFRSNMQLDHEPEAVAECLEHKPGTGNGKAKSRSSVKV